MAKAKSVVGGRLRGMLNQAVRQGRRETVYRMLAKRHGGHVPCFVCGKHVQPYHATLEHITPLSKGGGDGMDNLSISHGPCNNRRGAATHPTQETPHE
jgi:5-methylcytosine-specific restriction endonuclease McrA